MTHLRTDIGGDSHLPLACASLLYLLWATVVDFALLRHAGNAGAPGFAALDRTPFQLLCYAEDIAFFANSRSQLHTTVQAIHSHSNLATALAAIGVRLNAAKSYFAPSPTVKNIQPMTSSHSALKGPYENNK